MSGDVANIKWDEQVERKGMKETTRQRHNDVTHKRGMCLIFFRMRERGGEVTEKLQGSAKRL